MIIEQWKHLNINRQTDKHKCTEQTTEQHKPYQKLGKISGSADVYSDAVPYVPPILLLM